MAFGFLKNLTGGGEPGEIRKLRKVAEAVNKLGEETEQLSDAQLKAKTAEFKERVEKGESLDNLLPEAFAVVREAAHRVIKERHFDVQLMGGASLHQGTITEMKTGEGKTLTSTLPAYLNALAGKGVHVVTVNEYLAKRDTEWMGQVYNFLGITVGNIYHGQAPAEKKAAYQADITYGTNNEFGFDYLRDNMVGRIEDVVQRDLSYAIVDEVDSILIDEARTPLIISAPSTQSSELYQKFAGLTPKLVKETHFTVDEKRKTAVLTDEGIKQMEQYLGVENIYEAGGVMVVHHLEQALQAQAVFTKDKEYVVKEGEVVLVDEFTGRLMPGRRFSEGLHQAIEAKEGVEIKEESRTMATITFQNYFRLYDKLSGMTGTAKTEEEEFRKIYTLDVVEIPTHRTLVRKDENDLIYKNEDMKFKAIAVEVKRRQETGQPVLLGTIAVEKSEKLSGYLTSAGVKHEILNAKNHAREAQIIADAGQKNAVTVSTNMAGRGTDIKLGDGVAELGGLHVLGSERHESRRIDNQLRGRSGRQGDPGSTQFFVSLEDDLMRIFAGDRIKGVMEKLKVPDDQPIEAKLISKSIESAQKKVEGHNFDIRKHVVQYDDVKNRHREVIYARRRKLLEKGDAKPDILDMFTGEIDLLLSVHAQSDDHTEWDYDTIAKEVSAMVPTEGNLAEQLKGVKVRRDLRDGLLEMVQRAYAAKESEQGEEQMRTLERMVVLRTIDTLWVDHLDALEHLRDDVDLRRYGQKDPLAEYKQEAFRLFEDLLGNIQGEVTRTLFKMTLTPPPPSEVEQAAKTPTPAVKGDVQGGKAKVGTPEPGEDPIEGPAQPMGKQAKKAANQQRAAVKQAERSEQQKPAAPEPKGETEPKAAPTDKSPESSDQPAESTTKVRVTGPGISAQHAEDLASTPSISETKEGSTTIRVKTRKGNAPNPTPAQSAATDTKIGRNDPCPCGSGLKYKKCGLINAPEHHAATSGK